MSRGGWSISSFERRGLLRSGILGAGSLLSGCGFRPVYDTRRAGGAEPALAGELAAVRVGLIPERFGQLVRRSLEQRLVVGAAPVAPRYELRVQASLGGDAVGIDREGSPTRIRSIATARWILLLIGPPEDVIATGFERSLDASNIPSSQFFAGDMSREAAERRQADALAQEVVTRVALALRRQVAPV